MDQWWVSPCHSALDRSGRLNCFFLDVSVTMPVRGLAASPSSSQGLTLAHFRAQLEHIRDTLLTLELNLSTFGTHRSH